MSILKILKKYKEFTYFIWFFLLIVVSITAVNFQDRIKKKQQVELTDALNNVYLNKFIQQITSNLENRFDTIHYTSKNGDTYESIINGLNISKVEKDLILKTIKKQKALKILKVNQKFSFKIDRLDTVKIIEFKIETGKKNEMIFSRSKEKKKFISKIIQKNLKKVNGYYEASITNSLYNSAIKIGIRPNIIIEFARLYGFQVDFQRDIWKEDSFQIIFEEFYDDKNKLIDTGEIIYANLILQDKNLQLYRFEFQEKKIDYFDENGNSIRKTLMKTPINGARLSSSFGKRKHPILGYTKMHTGTDFAAPMGTPIMASGDGVVTKAAWCGGGGNCVKIRHNSTYQTVYAHLSKFGRGIKKGVRVKQGQIIGYVGSTGLSTGPHLHYEVIENGKKVNSQKLKLPSGKILKGNERKDFEVSKIKIDVLKSDLIFKNN